MKLKTRFENFMGKLIYSVIIAHHHEDYISDDANNRDVIITPANIWHKKAVLQFFSRAFVGKIIYPEALEALAGSSACISRKI